MSLYSASLVNTVTLPDDVMLFYTNEDFEVIEEELIHPLLLDEQ